MLSKESIFICILGVISVSSLFLVYEKDIYRESLHRLRLFLFLEIIGSLDINSFIDVIDLLVI